jgi:hypothetical protein
MNRESREKGIRAKQKFFSSVPVFLISFVHNKKAMHGKSHGQASLPSAALPASGSRGRPIFLGPLSQAAPPHFLSPVRIRLD